MIEYIVVIELAAKVITFALPIGLVFLLAERLTSLFLKCVFGKGFGV